MTDGCGNQSGHDGTPRVNEACGLIRDQPLHPSKRLPSILDPKR